MGYRFYRARPDGSAAPALWRRPATGCTCGRRPASLAPFKDTEARARTSRRQRWPATPNGASPWSPMRRTCAEVCLGEDGLAASGQG